MWLKYPFTLCSESQKKKQNQDDSDEDDDDDDAPGPSFVQQQMPAAQPQASYVPPMAQPSIPPGARAPGIPPGAYSGRTWAEWPYDCSVLPVRYLHQVMMIGKNVQLL